MTRPPLVTCGVTAFNAAATIERAINSVLSQTWPEIEIVVADDASTDSTPEILARRGSPFSQPDSGRSTR